MLMDLVGHSLAFASFMWPYQRFSLDTVPIPAGGLFQPSSGAGALACLPPVRHNLAPAGGLARNGRQGSRDGRCGGPRETKRPSCARLS